MAAKNVLVGAPVTGTGGILRGPLGTALPTDETTVPNAALKKAGYVGEDGVTMKTDRSSEKIKAWGGDTVRVIQSDFECSFEFTFLETNEVSLKASYGDANVQYTAGTTSAGAKYVVTVNAAPLGSNVWVIEIKDGDARGRIVIPNGTISAVDDVKFSHSEATGRQITLDALPDDAGNNAYMYFDDGVKTA